MAEFWPRDRWPSPPSPHPSMILKILCLMRKHHWATMYWVGQDLRLIPHPPMILKILCLVRKHRWATMYWVGQDLPGWPQFEYCERCWKFRDIKKSTG